MSGRTDEAILRVDFLFDLATLEGRRKRAQFFKLINGAVGQVVPYTISWCICNAIQNRCTLRYCTVLIVRNVCAGVHMGVLWGGVQIGREHSLHNSVVNVIKNMCFMPGSWEPGAISMKSVRGVVLFFRGGGVLVGSEGEGVHQGKTGIQMRAGKSRCERGGTHAHMRAYARIAGRILPSANWKDATCWRFRTEMLQMHVSKMRTEAQNRHAHDSTHPPSIHPSILPSFSPSLPRARAIALWLFRHCYRSRALLAHMIEP